MLNYFVKINDFKHKIVGFDYRGNLPIKELKKLLKSIDLGQTVLQSEAFKKADLANTDVDNLWGLSKGHIQFLVTQVAIFKSLIISISADINFPKPTLISLLIEEEGEHLTSLDLWSCKLIHRQEWLKKEFGNYFVFKASGSPLNP